MLTYSWVPGSTEIFSSAGGWKLTDVLNSSMIAGSLLLNATLVKYNSTIPYTTYAYRIGLSSECGVFLLSVCIHTCYGRASGPQHTGHIKTSPFDINDNKNDVFLRPSQRHCILLH